MAIRINNAKNFAGELYATQTWVNSAVAAVVKEIALNYVENEGVKTYDGKLLLTKYDNTTATVALFDTTSEFATVGEGGIKISGIQNAINEAVAKVKGEAIGISAGEAIRLDTSEGSTVNEINVMYDDSTVGIDGEGKLTSLLTFKKLETPTEGFAASYQLQNGAGDAIGATIDIIKDQYLKNASLVWCTVAGGEYTEASKDTEEAIPCLKLEIWTNVNGPTGDDAKVSTIYMEATDLFDVYEAGNGLALDGNEFSVKISTDSELLKIADDTTAPALSATANGLAAGNIQKAIDYTVEKRLESVKKLVETECTLAQQGEASSTVYGCSVEGRVIAVYDSEGCQVYPEIVYASGTSTLTADFGEVLATPVTEKWTVLHTAEIEFDE